MLTLTEKAASHIKTVLTKENKPKGFLRLKVTSGGCSGLNYEFSFVDQTDPKDMVFEAHGAKLVTDSASHFYINGSIIDYFQTLMESGFQIKNPKAQTTCNCGTSFSI